MHRLVWLFALALAGCARHASSAGLGLTDDVRKIADRLSEQTTVESEHVGVSGTLSAGAILGRALREKASDRELLALLRHESPVVRAQVAREIILHLPARRAAVMELLRDEAPVEYLSGCTRLPVTVAFVVAEGFCMASEPEGAAVIRALRKLDRGTPMRSARAAAHSCGLEDDAPGEVHPEEVDLFGLTRAR